MTNTELLKNIFNLAKEGIYTSVENLPSDISKEVVEKEMMQIELRNLLKTNGNQERIDEIKAILYPPQENEEIGE